MLCAHELRRGILCCSAAKEREAEGVYSYTVALGVGLSTSSFTCQRRRRARLLLLRAPSSPAAEPTQPWIRPCVGLQLWPDGFPLPGANCFEDFQILFDGDLAQARATVSCAATDAMLHLV